MDPHTTRKEARSCKDCHLDPRAIGLGRGSVRLHGDGWRFSPALGPVIKGARPEQTLDAFVAIDGTPLVNFSRRGRLRTFNRDEIDSILTVGLCIKCHSDLSFPGKRPINSRTLEVISCQEIQRLKPKILP